jgi:hypothetical protein
MATYNQLYNMDKVKELIGQFPKEITSNPAFLDSFIYQVYTNIPVDITISDDGKSVSFEHSNMDRNSMSSSIIHTEYKLTDGNGMEVVTSRGTIEDGSHFCTRMNRSERPEGASIIDTTYERFLFDKDGVELASSSYAPMPNFLSTTRYDDLGGLRSQTVGVHKPKSWHDRGPNLPSISNTAYVKGTTRYSPNPAFAEIYSYETDRNGTIPNTLESVIGVVCNNPQSLAEVLGYAKYESGKLVSLEDGVDITAATRDYSLSFEESLEKIKDNHPREYENLKNKAVKSNQMYKPQEELSAGRSM